MHLFKGLEGNKVNLFEKSQPLKMLEKHLSH
jgi:hypothetical protein